MTSVLIVLSGAKVWTMKDGTPHSTGFWSLEFTTAHQKFTAAGLEVHIATPGGVTPTVDPLSGSHLLRERPRAVTAETRQHIEVSAGVALFPKEISLPPREWVERSLRVQRQTEMPRGGHFAALEELELLAEEWRAFFRPLRTISPW